MTCQKEFSMSANNAQVITEILGIRVHNILYRTYENVVLAESMVNETQSKQE